MANTMPNLHVQEFLRQYVTAEAGIKALEDQFKVDATWSTRHPELVLLKYNQIESDMSLPLVQECRGLILDSKKDWAIVAYPFKKFFNHGEPNAAPINWATARVQEKLDGSLMILYHHKGEWCVASSGNPDAAGQVNDFPFTFRELFWRVWNDDVQVAMERLHPWKTYMFELTSPYNRVVVPHTESKVTLIGMRDLDTGEELFVESQTDLFIVDHYPLGTLEETLETFKLLDGIHQEGYVVVDDNFNRVKIKHPRYVQLHHMKDGTTRKSMVEIVRKGESEEFLTYFPEFTEEFIDIRGRYNRFIEKKDSHFEWFKVTNLLHGGGVDRKSFAANVIHTDLPGFYFSRLDNKCKDIKDYVANHMTIDNVMKALGLK